MRRHLLRPFTLTTMIHGVSSTVTNAWLNETASACLQVLFQELRELRLGTTLESVTSTVLELTLTFLTSGIISRAPPLTCPVTMFAQGA